MGSRRRGFARRALSAGLSLAVAVPALAACFAEPSPHNAVKDFLVGWQTGDYAAAARRTDGEPKEVGQALENAKLQLDAASIRFSLQKLTTDGDNADAKFHVEVDLGDNSPLWMYDNDLPLHLVNGEWKVRWSPSVIHPELRAGQRFAVDATSEGRQPILDRNGDPLQQEATLYVAGVVPATLKDRETLCEQLYQLTGFAQDRLLSRIVSAPPQSFVPLVTFGRAKYAQLRDRLDGISGLQIQMKRQPVAPAQPVEIIGKVGTITAETEQQLGGPQRAGDTVGQGGLQKAYQDQLTGSTGTRVITYDLKTGEQVAELAKWEGRLNTSVKTTLDKGVQRAADAAVAGSAPALLVAVKASTGDILAVGSRQLDQEHDALAGRFPPGTVFSMVAADGLLEAGVEPGQKVPCPADRTVGGARFQQAAGPPGGAPTLTSDFAHGCVTALAAMARRVDANTLARSAERFGIGADWSLPLRSYSGSVPQARTDAAKARVITGQTVRVSPLSMALAAGAVASGTWRPPTLVTAPAAPDLTSEVAPVAPPKPIALDPEVLDELRSLMRSGVTSGAASAAAAPGGAPVYGVVSAVSYTEKKRQRSLSWFVGWQGDVAVAVMAETPSPTLPAQMAGQFFRGLPSSS
ncbi:penicillin-binding transpeptidase domain-containing protein [Sphaerisporangium sp. B11E5]|uniref:penicillin-binding transpeptidase domain-containing protein n=1 Tax=Sphaerisporangium sp. B11E5 TaxID=3153563 RepID=UPI00325CA969